MTLTRGLHLGQDTPERRAAARAQVSDRAGETVPESRAGQGSNEVAQAARRTSVGPGAATKRFPRVLLILLFADEASPGHGAGPC